MLRADDRRIAKFAPFSLQLMAGVMSPGLTGSADDSATRGACYTASWNRSEPRFGPHRVIPINSFRFTRRGTLAAAQARSTIRAADLSDPSVATFRDHRTLSQVITGSERPLTQRLDSASWLDFGITRLRV